MFAAEIDRETQMSPRRSTSPVGQWLAAASYDDAAALLGRLDDRQVTAALGHLRRLDDGLCERLAADRPQVRIDVISSKAEVLGPVTLRRVVEESPEPFRTVNPAALDDDDLRVLVRRASGGGFPLVDGVVSGVAGLAASDRVLPREVLRFLVEWVPPAGDGRYVAWISRGANAVTDEVLDGVGVVRVRRLCERVAVEAAAELADADLDGELRRYGSIARAAAQLPLVAERGWSVLDVAVTVRMMRERGASGEQFRLLLRLADGFDGSPAQLVETVMAVST